MTEDEAKQKMCPHFASAALQTPGMGRLEQDEIVTAMRCKGSDCMMWRSHRLGHVTHGYCGLAGIVNRASNWPRRRGKP